MNSIEATVVKQLEVVSGIFGCEITVDVLENIPPELLPGYINLFGAPRIYTKEDCYRAASNTMKDAANWLAARLYSEFYKRNFTGSALCEMNSKFLAVAGEPAFDKKTMERIENTVRDNIKAISESPYHFPKRVSDIVLAFLIYERKGEKMGGKTSKKEGTNKKKDNNDSTNKNSLKENNHKADKNKSKQKAEQVEAPEDFSSDSVLKEVRHIVEDEKGNITKTGKTFSKGSLTTAFAREIVEKDIVIPKNLRKVIEDKAFEIVLGVAEHDTILYRIATAKHNLSEIYSRIGPKISATFESEEDINKVHGLDSGRLSSRHLVGAMSLDPNIYYDMKEDVGEDTAISIIMDSSGSMRRGNLDHAGVGASVVLKAAWSKANTRLCFTSSGRQNKTLLNSIYVLKDFDQPGERDSLIEDCLLSCVAVDNVETSDHRNNYIPSSNDPHLHAILHEVVGLAKRPEKRKILLFFSDFHITRFPTAGFINGELRSLDPSLGITLNENYPRLVDGTKTCNIIKQVVDKYGVQIGFVSINNEHESTTTKDMLDLYRRIGKVKRVKMSSDLMNAIPSLCNDLLREWRIRKASQRL